MSIALFHKSYFFTFEFNQQNATEETFITRARYFFNKLTRSASCNDELNLFEQIDILFEIVFTWKGSKPTSIIIFIISP